MFFMLKLGKFLMFLQLILGLSFYEPTVQSRHPTPKESARRITCKQLKIAIQNPYKLQRYIKICSQVQTRGFDSRKAPRSINPKLLMTRKASNSDFKQRLSRIAKSLKARGNVHFSGRRYIFRRYRRRWLGQSGARALISR